MMIDIKILVICITIVFGFFVIYKFFIQESDEEYIENTEYNDNDAVSEPQYDLNELRENREFEDNQMNENKETINHQFEDNQMNENKETNQIIYRKKKSNK